MNYFVLKICTSYTIFLMSVVCSHTRFPIPHFFIILGSAATLGKWGLMRNNGGPHSHMQTSVMFLNKTGPIAHGYLRIYYSATAKLLLCQSRYENLLKESLQPQAGTYPKLHTFPRDKFQNSTDEEQKKHEEEPEDQKPDQQGGTNKWNESTYLPPNLTIAFWKSTISSKPALN